MTLGRPSVLTLVGLTALSALLFASLVSYVPSPPRNEVSQVLCGAFLSLTELQHEMNLDACYCLLVLASCVGHCIGNGRSRRMHLGARLTRQYWD